MKKLLNIMSLNLARFAGVKHSFGEQVIEHGLSAKIITSILTEWPFHRLTKKRLSKHGIRGTAMEWISVKDRLPEPGKIVLVHQVYSWQRFEDGAAVTVGRLRPTENGRVSYWEFQYYRPDFRDGTVLDNGIICPGSEYITHWMPLPEPPREDV